MHLEDADKRALFPYPSRLYIETTTRCNLTCQICPRTHNSSADRDIPIEIIERLVPVMAKAESLILNGIGETLLNPKIVEILRHCKYNAPDSALIGFQTNGQVISKTLLKALIKAGLNRLCLSMHQLETPETYHKNIKQYNHLFHLLQGFKKDLLYGVEIVLTRHNLFVIPEILRELEGLGVSFVILSHLLPYDKDSLSLCAYDINTQKAVSIYKDWLKKGLRRGIDIRDYYKVIQRFYHDHEDRLLLQTVHEMKQEASAEGVNLFLHHLIQREDDWFDRAEGALNEIRLVSEGLSMEVTIPNLYPSNIRCCEFVDRGAMFVSAEGDVSPCYYLWHRYSCYIGGIKKDVRPWFFGNIKDDEPLSIWQRADFAAFRQEVIRYRFPFCFDCSFALCNLVDGTEFENDCYISSVPCGACLWCTGLFNCLL